MTQGSSGSRPRGSRLRPPAPKKKTTRTKWLARPGKLISVGVISLIVAILIIFRDALLPQFFQKDVIGDQVREAQGSPVLRVEGVERFKLGDEAHIFAMIDENPLSPSQEQVLQNRFRDTQASEIIAGAERNGVPVGYATWRVRLQGGRNQLVRLIDVRPVNVTREKPISGTLFFLPPQGADDTRLIGLDMDEPEPRARELRLGGAPGGTLGDVFFGNKTLTFADKEEEILMVRALTRRSLVSFGLELTYTVGGKEETVRFDNNGRPFQVTSFSCAGPQSSLNYKRFYSLGTGVDGDYSILPEEPISGRC